MCWLAPGTKKNTYTQQFMHSFMLLFSACWHWMSFWFQVNNIFCLSILWNIVSGQRVVWKMKQHQWSVVKPWLPVCVQCILVLYRVPNRVIMVSFAKSSMHGQPDCAYSCAHDELLYCCIKASIFLKNFLIEKTHDRRWQKMESYCGNYSEWIRVRMKTLSKTS